MEAQELREALSRATPVLPVPDGFRVGTQCLYPSNNSVLVTVRGGVDAFVVSDDGGAALELSNTGYTRHLTDRQIGGLVKPQGLKVRDGTIYSPIVPLKAVPAAVTLVANASKEVADWGTQHLKFRVRRNFKEELTKLLDRHFHDNMKHDSTVIGASNKPHKFGHIIFLPGDKRLIVDPVINDPSSINSRVVANMDVKLAKDPNVLQLIVYDDAAEWQSSDLALLELGATTVGFSSAERTIQRLAA
ncbi:MAG: hypothetical protein AB1942_25730 [Pseudomonadota bacterium]